MRGAAFCKTRPRLAPRREYRGGAHMSLNAHNLNHYFKVFNIAFKPLCKKQSPRRGEGILFWVYD